MIPIFVYWLLHDVTTPRTTVRRYFEKAAGLNREKLGAYKPEEDFKPSFEEKIRFFRFFKNIFVKK